MAGAIKAHVFQLNGGLHLHTCSSNRTEFRYSKIYLKHSILTSTGQLEHIIAVVNRFKKHPEENVLWFIIFCFTYVAHICFVF